MNPEVFKLFIFESSELGSWLYLVQEGQYLVEFPLLVFEVLNPTRDSGFCLFFLVPTFDWAMSERHFIDYRDVVVVMAKMFFEGSMDVTLIGRRWENQ